MGHLSENLTTNSEVADVALGAARNHASVVHARLEESVLDPASFDDLHGLVALSLRKLLSFGDLSKVAIVTRLQALLLLNQALFCHFVLFLPPLSNGLRLGVRTALVAKLFEF